MGTYFIYLIKTCHVEWLNFVELWMGGIGLGKSRKKPVVGG